MGYEVEEDHENPPILEMKKSEVEDLRSETLKVKLEEADRGDRLRGS